MITMGGDKDKRFHGESSDEMLFEEVKRGARSHPREGSSRGTVIAMVVKVKLATGDEVGNEIRIL
jgi:hypothetical protein